MLCLNFTNNNTVHSFAFMPLIGIQQQVNYLKLVCELQYKSLIFFFKSTFNLRLEYFFYINHLQT